jgi:hypothetical protein
VVRKFSTKYQVLVEYTFSDKILDPVDIEPNFSRVLFIFSCPLSNWKLIESVSPRKITIRAFDLGRHRRNKIYKAEEGIYMGKS